MGDALAAFAVSGIGSVLGGNAQKKAASSALAAQNAAADKSIEMQLKMWEQARDDFAPYLEYGVKGLGDLERYIPAYMDTVVAPLYKQYMGYSPQAAPDPYGYMVNPITGQVQAPRAPQYTEQEAPQRTAPNLLAALPERQRNDSLGELRSTLPVTQNNALMRPSGVTSAVSERPATPISQMGFVPANTGNTLAQNNTGRPWYTAWDRENTIAQNRTGSLAWNRENTIFDKMGNALSGLVKDVLSGNFTPMYSEYAPNTVRTQNAFEYDPNTVATPTQQQLEQGGVLSPVVPEFQRGLDLSQYSFDPNAPMPDAPTIDLNIDYQFNTNDPVYQQKLAEKNKAIDAFLAKQGLQGSTAGETYRQNELNKLLAEEDQRQYSRAVSDADFRRTGQLSQYDVGANRSNVLYGRQLGENELGYGRGLTERNYLTQTDVDRYKLLNDRGNTLYGRLTGQQDALYNRVAGSSANINAQNQNLLAGRYGMGSDIYNMLYGRFSDAAKFGAGAAGATGNQAISTGQSIGRNMLYAGDAAAQAALANGQATAGTINTLANLPMDYLAMKNLNYYNPTTPSTVPR